jgi:hypothetical protein
MMRARPLLLSLFALVGAACDDDVVGQLAPLIVISPERLDFGTVELSQEARLGLVAENLQVVAGRISSIDVADDCEGCFLVIEAPGPVPATTKVDYTVRFRAVRLQAATGTITFTTDDPKAPTIQVLLIGRGSDSRRPDIAVAPERVDFGFVPAGGVGVSSFVVRSTGTNDLLVDRISIDPPTAPFRITTSTPSPERPGVMRPGAQVSVSLRATLPETETGTVTARILIETNVLEEKNVPGRKGVLAVPLVAKANLPPIARVGEAQTVEPWSRATLDGSGSFDQDDPPDEPLTYRWEIIRRPDGSTTQLERARTPQPSFWVDLAGRYEIALVVTDAIGLESQNGAVAVVEALPTNAVRIELIWDHPEADLDLHLVRAGGTFCDCANDVHYRDCGRRPDWFPVTPGANPRLDVDDRSGFGPENINIDGEGPERFIPDGRYAILVHYYSANAGVSTWPTKTAEATVRVYLYGLLAAELKQPLALDGDLWTAGTLNWPERTITPSQSVLGAQTCAMF